MTSLILSTEMSDDYVSKFTSLVRARDYSSLPRALGVIRSFWRCTINYSDSDSDRDNAYHMAIQ